MTSPSASAKAPARRSSGRTATERRRSCGSSPATSRPRPVRSRAPAGWGSCAGSPALCAAHPAGSGSVRDDTTVQRFLVDLSPPELREAWDAVEATELTLMETDDERSQMAY